MNGTRLHAFDIEGRIDSKPVGHCNEPAPDMATPVMFGHRMFCAQEKLFELACTSRGLEEPTAPRSGPFATYAALVAGPTSVLAIGNSGQLVMFDGGPSRREPSTLAVLAADPGDDAGGGKNPVFSHPAFVGTRMFIRGDSELVCVELAEKPQQQR